MPSSLLLALVVCASAQTPPRADDEVLKGFVSTRGSAIVMRPTSRPGKRKPAPTNQTAASSGDYVGIGYTLFKKDAQGQPVRVDPAYIFHAGDEVRLMIESNISGHLYVFTTENDGPPEMIFPDARLQNGGNRITAHVPHETPSSREPDPDFRWFYFRGAAATERFFIIVAREPLPGVPAAEALVAFCQRQPKDCPWKPPASFWKQLINNADTAAREGQQRSFGQLQTADERQAVSRGVGLPPRAPSPTKVKMSASTQARMLMMKIELIHK